MNMLIWSPSFKIFLTKYLLYSIALSLQNRIRVLQGPDGYVYVLQTSDEIKKQSQFDDLGDAEMLVYQCIERSDNQGIWLREIKARTGLHSVWTICVYDS